MKSIVETHFDLIAKDYQYYKSRQIYYYTNLKRILHAFIPRNSDVFEVGCGTGHMISSLKPKYGYGFDISSKMIQIAKESYTKDNNLHFSTSWPKRKFDYIFMCDVIEHLEKPSETFINISKIMNKRTVFICTMANPIWEPILLIWEWIGQKMPEGPHSRISINKLEIILKQAGLKMIKHDYKLLIPIRIPFLTDFVNKYLEKYFRRLAFIEYFVATKF